MVQFGALADASQSFNDSGNYLQTNIDDAVRLLDIRRDIDTIALAPMARTRVRLCWELTEDAAWIAMCRC